MDQNKSALTERVTAVAECYLDAIGCKPVETEVPIREGWVADIASFCYPTQTEFKKSKWHRRFVQPGVQINDVFDTWRTRIGTPVTVLVEVKVTRADFMKDIGRKFEDPKPPATFCYIACPKELAPLLDYPAKSNWGMLLMAKDGRSMVTAEPGSPNAQHPGDLIDLIAAVAMRRDNRSRYGYLRSVVQRQNADETDRLRTRRIHGMMEGILGYLLDEGLYAEVDSLKTALQWSGSRINMGYTTEKLCNRMEELKRRIASEPSNSVGPSPPGEEL